MAWCSLKADIALLEAKWEKANLAASELFSFLEKVEGKLPVNRAILRHETHDFLARSAHGFGWLH